MKFRNDQAIDIVFALVETIKSNKAYLGEIDGAIGDGDHGINMAKGFSMTGDRLKAEGTKSFSEGLQILGDVLLMDIGGSMGPLYGSLFGEMGEAGKPHEEIDRDVFGQMLDAGYDGLRAFDKAQIGDKSLQDCLMPAIAAYHAAQANGEDFTACLTAMKAAAYTGWQSTKDLVAKIGRASRLGERSRGTLDAGATSCYLMLAALCDEIPKKL